MAKLYALSQETEELILRIANEDIDESFMMNIKCFGSKKQKQVIKVKKATPIEESMGNSPDTVIICVNEDIFIRLDERQQELIVRDAMSQISYDDKKERIVVTQPQISVTLYGKQKFGQELMDAIETSILIREQLDEQEKEEKEAKKLQNRFNNEQK